MSVVRLSRWNKLEILNMILIDIKEKFDSTPFGEEVAETEKQIYDSIKNNIDILIPPDDMIILKKYIPIEPIQFELSMDYKKNIRFYTTFDSKIALRLYKYGEDIKIPKNLRFELMDLLNKNIPQDTLNKWAIILDRYNCEIYTIYNAYKELLDKMRTLKQLSKYPEMQKYYKRIEEIIQKKSAQEIIKLFNQE